VSIPRIYQTSTLKSYTTIRLDEKASHHVAYVLRAKPGDSLVLFNGKGGEYTGVINRIDKKYVEVEIKQFIAHEVESEVAISLAQGIARGDKMDVIVQKSVELGVQTIMPLITERCHFSKSSAQQKRLAHWQAVAISACEQCGRNRLPSITAPIMFNEWIELAKADHCFVLSPYHAADMNFKNLPEIKSIILLVGSEGGLTDDEVHLAIHHQFSPLYLGPRILRTETASLAAISIIQAYLGDMKIFL